MRHPNGFQESCLRLLWIPIKHIHRGSLLIPLCEKAPPMSICSTRWLSNFNTYQSVSSSKVRRLTSFNLSSCLEGCLQSCLERLSFFSLVAVVVSCFLSGLDKVSSVFAYPTEAEECQPIKVGGFLKCVQNKLHARVCFKASHCNPRSTCCSHCIEGCIQSCLDVGQ